MNNNWSLVRIDKILKLQRRWIQLEPLKQYQEIGLRSFGKGIFHKTPVYGADLGSKRVLEIHPGDLILSNVFAWEGAVGVATEAERGMIGSHRFITYTPIDNSCSVKYLQLFFHSPEGLEVIRKVSPGSAGRNRTLNLKQFDKAMIPLPPIAEQRRIVARIEELAAKIEEARGLRESAIGQVNQLETSASHNCFESLLKDGIKSVPFERVCRKITVGHVSSMRHAYRDIGISFLRSQNVRRNRFEPRGLCFIAPEFHESNPKSSLSPGDVVVVRTGFVGVACVIPDSLQEANCADLVIVRPDRDQLDSSYASHFLNSYGGKQQALESSVGSAQKHYNVGAMRKTLIPLPSKDQQAGIVSYLNTLEAQVSCIRNQREAALKEFDALLPAILDKAFKGEL